ncbi:sugar ABC transporter (plasmid) [Acinetobacter sp. ESL0695]|uniref:sugar ABC transporter n=1 Tax=Acinetobacter sp. ESL0695 TaxID=2983215 RepID=UPI0023F0859B|nr:sugar ABC transporter [Acinetobacter sp. ESL0695]WEV50203.1 sugar ABC transporter [Acinetobacter sp. ESL0695]
MLYTVECSYADKNTEQEWNDFYSKEKLPALISVKGFITSQRFKALTPNCPTYLAIHTIQDESVITSDEYKQKGGGNFARWQANITNWHRNIYENNEIVPEIFADQILLLSTHLLYMDAFKLKPIKMQSVALGHSLNYRMAYVLQRNQAELIGNIADIHIYEPITIQLKTLSNIQLCNEV